MKKLILTIFIVSILTSCDMFVSDVTGFIERETDAGPDDVITPSSMFSYYLGTNLSNYSIGGTKSTAGSISIPSSSQGKNVVSIVAQGFKNNSNITAVSIPTSIATIQTEAFLGCRGMQEVNFNEGLTAIGESSFNTCTSLSCVIIPSSVTTIGESAFAGCTSITSLYLGEKIDSIGSDAFANCSNLKEVIVPVFENRGDGIFSGCNSLTIYSESTTGNAGEDEIVFGVDSDSIIYRESWCKISFDSAGGSFIAPLPVKKGEARELPSPQWPDGSQTFSGWENGTTEFTGSTVITSDISLKAKWE